IFQGDDIDFETEYTLEIPPSTIMDSSQENEQCVTLIWFQLFIDVIQYLTLDNKAKEEMLRVCRCYYQNNSQMLNLIDKFDKTYHVDKCINWYTKQSFVYELINKALRTEDIEQLYTFRYYIVDLSKKLVEKCKNIKANNDEILYLYRGTKINREEVEKFKLRTTNEGREVVMKYIEENRREMEYESPKMMVGILLKRIGKYKESLQYFMNLLENPGEENVAYIHNRIGIALRNERKYHHKQREFDQAIVYYRQALSIIENESDNMNRLIAELYGSMGRTYLGKGDCKEALSYQEKALEKRQSCLPSYHYLLAFSYVDIAKIFFFQQKYVQALEWNRKALEFRQKYLLPDHVNTAFSLYYVGKMCYKIGKSEEARDYYLKSIEMTKKCLPVSQQHTIPKILEDIASTYGYKSETALNYRLEALKVQQQLTSINYSYLAYIHDNIARTYKSMDKKADSLQFYEQALQIRKENLPTDAFRLFNNFNNLASLYEEMGDVKSALTHYHEALKIYRHHPSYHRQLYNKTRNNIKRLSNSV
ncbi:unnamed protein product, partial [Rotaria sordida]